jgi:hypothetical protein
VPGDLAGSAHITNAAVVRRSEHLRGADIRVGLHTALQRARTAAQIERHAGAHIESHTVATVTNCIRHTNILVLAHCRAGKAVRRFRETKIARQPPAKDFYKANGSVFFNFSINLLLGY